MVFIIFQGMLKSTVLIGSMINITKTLLKKIRRVQVKSQNILFVKLSVGAH